MSIKQILLLFLSALFVSACAHDNEADKYGGSGDGKLPEGEIAHFPLDENLSNAIEESPIKLLYDGRGNAVFVSGGVNGSKALKLNGIDNYLAIPAGVYDTLSVVFWVKMDNEEFRTKNAKPVWFDYGMGAIKVAVDGATGSTKLLITKGMQNDPPETQLLPNDKWSTICTWDNRTFFYAEITEHQVTGRIVARYADHAKADYTFSTNRNDSPIGIKSDVLYIGRSAGIGPFTGSYLEGIVDDIHLYNRHLTETEVNTFAQIPLD